LPTGVSKPVLYIIYILIVPISLVAGYTLLNAGSPNSLLRPIVPDPGHDVYVAIISSILVFILGFVVFYMRDREGFGQLIAMNADKIRKERKKGKSDAEIAESILSALKIRPGRRYNMARKKLVAYLSDFK
jgi:hypothetical protein